MARAPCPNFTTKRLLVQEWTSSLSDPLARTALVNALSDLLTEPVLRFLPEPVQLDPKSDNPVDDWIDLRQSNGTIFTVRRPDSTLIGLLTLAEPAHDDLRLGYLLGEEHWGNGYASELIKGFLSALPDRPGRVIHGGVDPANVASARVLVKAGFGKDNYRSSDDIDMYTLKK